MTACKFHPFRPATHVVERWSSANPSPTPLSVEYRCAECLAAVVTPLSPGYLVVKGAT